MGAILLFVFFLYVILSIAFVSFVGRGKSPKATKWAIAFVVLLPTWDALIALLIFIPANFFWSGNTINEHITTTNMSFDLIGAQGGIHKSNQKKFFFKGIEYAEIEIKKIVPASLVKETGIYGFWLDEKGDVQFKRIEAFTSQYLIQQKEPSKISLFPINFLTRKIIDKKTGKIVASWNYLSVRYLTIGPIPFFNYLNWDDHPDFFFGSKNRNEDEIYKAIN